MTEIRIPSIPLDTASVRLAICDFGGVMFVEEEDVDDDEGGADGDGGVGYVEGRPVIAAEPDFEEVCHGAVDDAVRHISGGTAEEKSKTGGSKTTATVAGDKQPSQGSDDYRGADDQQDAHAGGRRIGEDTEGNAGIAAVHEVDEIVDHLAVPAFNRL